MILYLNGTVNYFFRYTAFRYVALLRQSGDIMHFFLTSIWFYMNIYRPVISRYLQNYLTDSSHNWIIMIHVCILTKGFAVSINVPFTQQRFVQGETKVTCSNWQNKGKVQYLRQILRFTLVYSSHFTHTAKMSTQYLITKVG